MVARARAGSGRGGARRRVKGRTDSSTRWLVRQFSDPYVREARRIGYRSRSAFKLLELDDRFRLLGPGKRVLDLGAAPGGWTQVALARVRPEETGGRVVAVDVGAMEPLPGAVLLQLDARAPEAIPPMRAALGGPADLVLSDMAAPATGHSSTDAIRVAALAEAAFEIAAALLAPGGTLVVKVLQGGATGELLALFKRDFRAVRHAKPPASRSESRETYLVATGFRGER